jgi:hypothetical protein
VSKRWLPDYVTVFTDRHGRQRFRYRRKGFEGGYFKAAPGTEEFRRELKAFESGKIDSAQQAMARTLPGTIDELVTRYMAVPSRLGPTEATQRKIRAVLSNFRAAHAHRIVADVQFEHIEAIVEKAKAKRPSEDGKRTIGGVEAARKLRKELVRLFDFSIAIRQRQSNPVRQAAKVKVAAGERSKGFHTWTEQEIAQYRAHHIAALYVETNGCYWACPVSSRGMRRATRGSILARTRSSRIRPASAGASCGPASRSGSSAPASGRSRATMAAALRRRWRRSANGAGSSSIRGAATPGRTSG